MAAILLMGILLFNWLGYRLLTSYWENKANTRLVVMIDQHSYDESQLITVKIPAGHVLAYSNTHSFERVNGQIVIGGIQYNYVERRLSDDSLEYRCLPNHAAMGLQTARDEFFKLVNDLQQHKSTTGKPDPQHPGASKSFSADYYTANEQQGLDHQHYLTVLPARHERAVPTSNCYALTAEQPPDLRS